MGGGGGGVEERLNKLEKEKEGGEVNKGSGKARVSLLFCEAVTVTNWTGLEPRNS